MSESDFTQGWQREWLIRVAKEQEAGDLSQGWQSSTSPDLDGTGPRQYRLRWQARHLTEDEGETSVTFNVSGWDMADTISTAQRVEQGQIKPPASDSAAR